MAYPLINPTPTFWGSPIAPLSGGTIEFRDPATDVLIDSYPTADDADAQTNANANPLTLNSRGEAPNGLFLEDGVTYKIILKDSLGATIWHRDDVKSPDSLTQSGLASVLSPQTAEEALAAVTPTSFQYDPGDVRRYGAVLDGATDDSAAWNSADLQAAQGGPPIFVPSSANGMATASALSTDYRTDVYFEPGGFIVYTGSSDIAVLTLGGTAANNALRRSYENVHVIRESQGDWTDEASIGVQATNLISSKIDIRRVEGFTRGLYCLGDTLGFAYNQTFIGEIWDCKVSLNLDTNNGGYCNENTFIGGRLSNGSTTNTTLDRWGIRLDASHTTPSAPNSNLFLKQSIEAWDGGSGVARPILINYGLWNRFEEIRDESNDAPFMECENTSTSNVATVTTNAVTTVRNDGDFLNNFVYPTRNGVLRRSTHSWSSGAIHRTCNEYDGAGAVYVPGCSIRNSSNGNQSLALASITVADDYLDIAASRGVGVMVDTETQKRFIFRREVVSGRGGRIVVIPYDATVTQLTLTDTFADGDVTVGTDRITVTGHPFVDGDQVDLTTTGALPTGLATSTDYYVNSVDANTIELYSDKALTSIIDITAAAGGGTHTIRIQSRVSGSSSEGFVYTSNSGGAYTTGGDSDNDVFVGVDDQVQFVWIGYFGGSSTARVRSFGLESIDGGAMTVFQGYTDANSDPFPNDLENYATAAPATATAGPNYPAGKRISRFNATSGSSPGWVCTTQGLGGTAVFESEGTGAIVVKAATESVTSSTTLQDDDELTIAVTSGTLYAVEMMLEIDALVSATQDFKFDFGVPGASTGSYMYYTVDTAGSAFQEVGASDDWTADQTAIDVPIAGRLILKLSGTLTAGANGNITLRWAQNASSANDTRVIQGSWLKVTKQ